MDNEIWKDVVGYEGLYQVSSLGRIKSLDKKVNQISRRYGKKINIEYIKRGLILNGGTHGKGYKQILLRKDGIQKTYKVHRLVCIAFYGYKENMEVNHINFIRDDNRIENLEWVTSSQNRMHTINAGRAFFPKHMRKHYLK